MTYYAIRTLPGAQMPQREYVVEETKSKKGYRHVPSLNPNISAIERALQLKGFEFYMPVERRLVRDRKKAGLWKLRRFPLLQGYVFVKDVQNWPLLSDTPGVAGIVGLRGTPMPISLDDLAILSRMEAEAELLVQRELERRKAAEQKLTRRKAGLAFPKGTKIEITKGIAAGKFAYVTDIDRDGRLKAISSMFESSGLIFSVPVSDVRLVA